MIQEEPVIRPGHPFSVAIQLKIKKDWHLYWKNPGEMGLPIEVEWKLPEGFQVSRQEWSIPEQFFLNDLSMFGYEEEAILFATITPPAVLSFDRDATIAATLSWLSCSLDACQPGTATVHLALQPSVEMPILRPETAELFQKIRAEMPRFGVALYPTKPGSDGQPSLEESALPAPLMDEYVYMTVPFALKEQESFLEVQFFPEELQKSRYGIDLKSPIKFSPLSATSCLVGLKREGPPAPIKGLLVLKTHEEGKQVRHSFVVDLLNPDSEEILALADAPLPSNRSTKEAQVTPSASPQQFEGGLGLALLFAFVGGMILNLMPCVLPVLSLKVISFLQMSKESASLRIKHAGFFTFGVILSFWVLAAALLILRHYGQAVGWGFQLQEPLFVVMLASLLFLLGLNLLGVFEWGTFFASWAGQTVANSSRKRGGYVGSFLNGVVATAVATPCTGPFLGSAVGFALGLPPFKALLIFTYLGMGVSFPYLLLACFPAWLKFVPKPGYWMEIFKGIMGFMLLATVVWLLSVFAAETNEFSVILLVASWLCLGIAGWIYGQCGRFVGMSKRKQIGYAFVLIFLCAAVELVFFSHPYWNEDSSYDQQLVAMGESSPRRSDWEPFSPQRVEELRNQGTPVLIDFTAKWCLICQSNHMAFTDSEVEKRLKEAGVVKMKADWTKRNAMITEALAEFGRSSVPLYVIYGVDKREPWIMPQVLTPGIILQNLDEVLSP